MRTKVVVLVLLVVCFILGYSLYREHAWSNIYFSRLMLLEDKLERARSVLVASQVKAYVAAYRTAGQYGTVKMTPEFREAIQRDPKQVLALLVLNEARWGWPGISTEDACRIEDEAGMDSAKALDDLKVVIRKNSDARIRATGKDPNQNNWDNNNVPTAILFLYWPKAIEKGKGTEFVAAYINGDRETWHPWVFGE